ncbi:MAG: hypothetical protein GYA34_04760 [Chloroflexi bacterium]|nr:hypothetical protein [Chloroflexota bacterium]
MAHQGVMGDEDEGSCPQGQVNRETGKIERSAEALRVCLHPIPFPPKENYPIKAYRVTGGINAGRVALPAICD